MPTLQQKLFNLWIEKCYPTLRQQMPLQDMLHSAYITVYQIRRPVMPIPDTFSRLMNEAYHRHVLKEFNHQMQFPLPDPIFWMFADEDMPDDTGQNDNEADESNKRNSIADLDEKQFNSMIAFVRRHVSPTDYIIFRMALIQQLTVKQIADVVGLTKPEVIKSLDNIERVIRNDYHPKRKRK